MNFDFLKDINYKIIISEIKKSRKGAVVIIFLSCLICAAIDFLIMRKHGIIWNWFGQIYAITAFISFNICAVKLFNRIADRVDAKKAENKKHQKITDNLREDLRLIAPVLGILLPSQSGILEMFINEGRTKITITEVKNGISDICSINKVLEHFKLQIKYTDFQFYVIAEIEPYFFALLKLYFNNKKDKTVMKKNFIT